MAPLLELLPSWQQQVSLWAFVSNPQGSNDDSAWFVVKRCIKHKVCFGARIMCCLNLPLRSIIGSTPLILRCFKWMIWGKRILFLLLVAFCVALFHRLLLFREELILLFGDRKSPTEPFNALALYFHLSISSGSFLNGEP